MSWYLFGLWITPYQFFIPADTPDRSWSLTTPKETRAEQVVDTIRAKQEPMAPLIDHVEGEWIFGPHGVDFWIHSDGAMAPLIDGSRS